MLSDFVYIIRGTARFDREGQFVQEMDHFWVVGERTYYNSVTGKSVFGSPAELENHRFYPATNRDIVSGPAFRLVVPGYGPILSETGHVEFVYVPETNTWDVVSPTGPSQLLGQDLAALCGYLK